MLFAADQVVWVFGEEVSSCKHHGNPQRSEAPQRTPLQTKPIDAAADTDSRAGYEFGGPVGVGAMMVGFPLAMWYMYVGAVCYDGALPLPADGQSLPSFAAHIASLAYTHAFPHARAWAIYWAFLVVEGLGYLYLPGVYGKGKYLPHLGAQLPYYCSGIWSWYITVGAALALHASGLFKLYTLLDEFGPLMSVAIVSGFLVAAAAYASAVARGAQHRMTGSVVYDFFMGAELNPRLLGWLDLKMFFEVRIPWYTLFLLSLGAALRQYEELGYVSGEVCFVLMAHALYANACAKGEELIITSWDMYYEKWGFMLIFWNLAGVPLTYCHCTIYLANHHPSEYRWHRGVLAVWFAAYLFAYWVWDTANSQKNMFRAMERGTALDRNTFPQLPWKYVENPRVIRTKTGDNILCDGWYGMARKIHYTCDWFFAFSWGLITGFNSPFPWFYAVFFTAMIIHRAKRDIERCRERYGEAWKEYERRVPYLFIPYVF
ncbi:C-24(28) sterol reductase [Diplodia intermedia]|uniref:Delta(24(24(1)))-sterol reductase n=1 Tax=Diplodia intermedia TaxID=856260 RepID=A0ABR3TRN7_9PEZI